MELDQQGGYEHLQVNVSLFSDKFLSLSGIPQLLYMAELFLLDMVG